jgi:hypothetical protein
MDLIWATHDGLVEWPEAGRCTDMGHAVYAADGSDLRQARPCPFRSEAEVWAFDAVEEYGLPDFDQQVRAYEDFLDRSRRDYPHQLTTGGYYKTVVSGAIAAFGWEMLLAAAADQAKMEKVFDSFFRRTLFYMKAWARTSADVVIQHDDFVWSTGPFMSSEVYRDTIIARYAELWKPLHEAGKKVLFCSDGNFMCFAEDLVAAGADGLIFEPCNDFGFMVDRFGHRACLVGSYVDCRDLAAGKWDKVRSDIDRTFEQLAACRGGLFAVGNHLAPNVSGGMLDRYFDRVTAGLGR